jgi:ribosomal protein S21
MALINPGILREYKEEQEREKPSKKGKNKKDQPISPLARRKWIEDDKD